MLNKNIVYAFFLICSINIFFAATITSTGTGGNWSAGGSWVGGVAPVAGDDAVIAVGATITVTSNTTVASVTINGGSNASTLLQINSGIKLIVTGLINISPPTNGNNDNTVAVGDGSLSCGSFSTTNSGTNPRRCVLTINNGTLTCSGNFQVDNNTTRNKVTFTGSGLLQLGGTTNTIANGQFTSSTGTVEYSASGNQTILALQYYSIKGSGSGVKLFPSSGTIPGDATIAGTAQVDVDAVNNYSLNIGGNWIVTSTNADPFLERNGSVTFNGSTGTQTINTVLAAGETFYKLTINSTSTSTPAIQTTKDINVTNRHNHTAGILDLNGKNLNINSTASVITTSSFSGGKIITSVSGSSITITDGASDSLNVLFSGTKVGDNSRSVPLSINVGRMCFSNLELYGAGTFTKTVATADNCNGGGNKYRSNVFFTAASTAAKWRWGDDPAVADTFFAKTTINALANSSGNNNFILGANSTGNYFVDSVFITSTTSGGVYIGRASGGTPTLSSSSTFAGHVEVNLTLSGNCTFADGVSTNPSSVIFLKTLRLNSSNTSTGDFFIGRNDANSTTTFSTAAQLISGTISGTTNCSFYNVTQLGTLSQSLLSAGTATSKVTIGSSTAPCTWNGPLSVSAPGIDLAYCTFNGTSNTFTFTANSATLSCTGGNTFGAASSNTFVNTGTGIWALANTAADDYNGHVTYSNASTGTLLPAYNTNCTYAGSITISSGSGIIDFANSASGRVTIDGNSSAGFTNNSSNAAIIKRITMNKTSGNFTLNNDITVSSGGDLTLTSGKIITSSSGLIELLDETCTTSALTAASTSYIDGPMKYDVSNNGTTQTLNFPIGKGSDCRPVILKVTHSSGTSYTYKAELSNASANALGWTLPGTVNLVSLAHYWDIDRTLTSSGASSPTAALTGNQTITVCYSNNDGVSNAANLTLCKNTSTATTAWIDIGGTGATATSGSVTSTSSPSVFTSFSRFTLGNKTGGSNSLPVELLFFKAIVGQENKVALLWATATENNNDHFEVEKSIDGINFEYVTSVKAYGNGTSMITQNYTSTDNIPFTNDLSYYRLKQTDKNGMYKYSDLVAINFTKKSFVCVYPNPASDKLTIATSEDFENATVRVISALGIDVTPTNIVKYNSGIIDLSNLISGIYYIVVSNGNDIRKVTVILQK